MEDRDNSCLESGRAFSKDYQPKVHLNSNSIIETTTTIMNRRVLTNPSTINFITITLLQRYIQLLKWSKDHLKGYLAPGGK
jgi:hypothetical protein